MLPAQEIPPTEAGTALGDVVPGRQITRPTLMELRVETGRSDPERRELAGSQTVIEEDMKLCVALRLLRAIDSGLAE